MWTRLFWPRCRVRLVDAHFSGQDAYWVSCSLEEAERELFPRWTEDQVERCMAAYHAKPTEGVPSDRIFALVSADLSVISAQPWWFPFAGQWNAYSPFREMEERSFHHLEDLEKRIDG